MEDGIKEILNQLISSPKESQIQVDCDIEKKIFILSVPIYRSRKELPKSVREYIEARKNRFFKPHETSFSISDNRTVLLTQHIPFQWGARPDVRQETLDFLKLAKRCHRMLYEIALEETYQTALQEVENKE